MDPSASPGQTSPLQILQSAQRTFYLHLKETEFRFNHRNNNLYKELLNFLRKDPL